MSVALATKSLLHDKLRFLSTVSGVAFAVTLVFVQVGLFIGLMDNASLTIEQIDADLWVTSHNTPNVDFAHTFPETYVKRVRSLPGIARADNLIVWFMNVNLPPGAGEGTRGAGRRSLAKSAGGGAVRRAGSTRGRRGGGAGICGTLSGKGIHPDGV